MCTSVVSPQPVSIVTVLVSESVWRRCDRIFGFGATPIRRHKNVIVRAHSTLVPLCISPHVPCIASDGRPSRCPSDVGPKGHPTFVGRFFRACAKPGIGPVLRPLRQALQHTMPESGRAPGPPAGPGSLRKFFDVSLRKFLRSSLSGDIDIICAAKLR